MSRTVLVTGGAGFLGSHLIQRILDTTDWNVVTVDSYQHNGKLWRLLAATGGNVDRVTSITHDLTIPFTGPQLDQLANHDVTIIYNVASRSHVGDSIRDPASFMQNNINLMINVLELARFLAVEQLVQMSTDEVYGPYRPASVYEHRPSSPYAASKAAQESICHAYEQTYDVPIVIINSANMIGERQQIGAYVPLVIGRLLRGEPVSVHFYGDRPGERNYVYVGNVATSLINVVANDVPRRLTIAGQETLTNVEVVERVAALLDVEPNWFKADGQLARSGYDAWYPQWGNNWNAPVSLQEGLKRTVNWGVIYFNEDR